MQCTLAQTVRWCVILAWIGNLPVTAAAAEAETPEKVRLPEFETNPNARRAPPELVQRLRSVARQRMALDARRFGERASRQIEDDYQAIRRMPGPSEQRKAACQKFLAAYGQSNRAGCICFELGAQGSDDEALQLLKLAGTKYADCWFGNGTQVGPSAVYALARYYRRKGNVPEAAKYEAELQRFPLAIYGDDAWLIVSLVEASPKAADGRKR